MPSPLKVKYVGVWLARRLLQAPSCSRLPLVRLEQRRRLGRLVVAGRLVGLLLLLLLIGLLLPRAAALQGSQALRLCGRVASREVGRGAVEWAATAGGGGLQLVAIACMSWSPDEPAEQFAPRWCRARVLRR